MKRCCFAILFLVAGSLTLPAQARDERGMYSIAEALDTPAAQEKLDKGVKLYFGKQSYPTAATDLGEWATNKKTNAVFKSDKESCQWVFLSAVLALQERARREGGNAVVGILSNYRNVETSSESEFMCGAGNIMSGVALKGRVVKLK